MGVCVCVGGGARLWGGYGYRVWALTQPSLFRLDSNSGPLKLSNRTGPPI